MADSPSNVFSRPMPGAWPTNDYLRNGKSTQIATKSVDVIEVSSPQVSLNKFYSNPAYEEIFSAIENNNDKHLKGLLAKNKDLDYNIKHPNSNKTMLLAAVHQEKPDINTLKTILEAPNIDINGQDDLGFSALHSAVQLNMKGSHHEVIELLLAQKNINHQLRTNKGYTPTDPKFPRWERSDDPKIKKMFQDKIDPKGFFSRIFK